MNIPTSPHTHKQCSCCHEFKPFDEFSKRKQSKDGLNVWCKDCVSVYNHKRVVAKRVKKAHRQSHRRIAYNLEPEMFARLEEEQQGRCAICDKEEKLMVDHDHDTGEVRGLLCRKCNTGLGFFGDDVTLLLKAADFLRSVK